MNRLSTLFQFAFGSWKNKEVILIVSSGRTGTNFMADWFKKVAPQVVSLHEPQPDLFYLGVNRFRKNYSQFKTYIKLKWARAGYLSHLQKHNKKVYIESNPNLVLLLPAAKQLFPNLKIIFIKRDLKDYLISAFNKSPDKSETNFYYADNDPRKRLTAIDVNNNPNTIDGWNKLGREERIAWWWYFANKQIEGYLFRG